MEKIGKSIVALSAVVVAGGVSAATIAPGNATADLGPNLFTDQVVSGGSDVTVNEGSNTLSRENLADLGALNVGPGGTQISITGIAWFGPNWTGTDATAASVSVLYLGADGVGGGGDDVVLGSASAAYSFGGAAEYVWTFDSPIVGIVDGANSFFRFDLTASNATGDGSFRMKSDAGVGIKMTVGGTSTAVPEPASLSLLAMGGLFMARRRRS